MTSNRLAVAQTNLESTGKENEEILDDKKSGSNNRPEPRNFFHFESDTNMARNFYSVVLRESNNTKKILLHDQVLTTSNEK